MLSNLTDEVNILVCPILADIFSHDLDIKKRILPLGDTGDLYLWCFSRPTVGYSDTVHQRPHIITVSLLRCIYMCYTYAVCSKQAGFGW